jgi:hypothetical protein
MIQLVRVVDSSRNEYCLEVITPNTSFDLLNQRHFGITESPRTLLGQLMNYLELDKLEKLSPVFGAPAERRSASWVAVYKELTEWAVLFSLVREKDFGTDTIIVRDGFLRSKMFARGLFEKYARGLEEGIRDQFERNRRRLYVVGIAKHSKVIHTYRVAMALDGVMRTAYPCYVEVPRQLEEKVYKWSEYATGGGEGESFVAGKMFLAKFGSSSQDPIWAVDLLISQAGAASTIFGHLLADAIDGFPVPFYPQCLQSAHESAALVDFDLDILQDAVCRALRQSLGQKGWIIDELALEHVDLAGRGYQ